MSTPSVEKHLKISIEEYDSAIRAYVPCYDEMVETGIALIKTLSIKSPHLIDLGSGTGRLAQAVLKQILDSRITLIDIDIQMLSEAKRRLESEQKRITFLEQSYFEPLPKADVVVASLSLHHVQNLDKKTEIYASIFKALRPNGIFLSFDATVSTDPKFSEYTLAGWVQHMGLHGISELEAQKHLAHWAKEEKYFPLIDELNALKEAGFKNPECFWRRGPVAIFGGIAG